MVATHVLDERDPDGTLSFAQALAGGRAAALFAVLAGVTLALMTGRREPVRGRERLARSAGMAVRALLIALLGLFLGGLGSGLAIILTYYGVLFLLGLPFVGLRAPALLGLAAGVGGRRPGVVPGAPAAPAGPRLRQPVLRPARPAGAVPQRAHVHRVLPGACPGWPTCWSAWPSAGWTSRSDGSRSGSPRAAPCSPWWRRWSREPDLARVRRRRAARRGGPPASSVPELINAISGGMFGNTPTGGPWQWLLVVAPHSTTPFDLAQTIGSSLAVIGALPAPGRGAGRQRGRGRWRSSSAPAP